MADYWVHVSESIDPIDYTGTYTSDENGNVTKSGYYNIDQDDQNNTFNGIPAPVSFTNPKTGQVTTYTAGMNPVVDGVTYGNSPLFGKAETGFARNVTAVNGIGQASQTNMDYVVFYLRGAIDSVVVADKEPTSTDSSVPYNVGTSSGSVSGPGNYSYSYSNDGGHFYYPTGFWFDGGDALSSLTVDPESKSESQVVQLSAVNSLTGLPNASAGTISYTDTDQTATVAGVLGTQTVTAVDQSGNPIALTDSQQAQLEAEFSLGTAAPATGSGSIAWTFQPSTSDAQILPPGATATVSTQVNLSDSDGNNDTAQVNVTESNPPGPTLSIVPQQVPGLPTDGLQVIEGGTAGSVVATLSGPSTQNINVHEVLDPDSGDSQITTYDFTIPAGSTTWTAPVVSATDDHVTEDTQTGNLTFTATNSDGTSVSFAQGPGPSSSQDLKLTVQDALTKPISSTDLTPYFGAIKSVFDLGLYAVAFAPVSNLSTISSPFIKSIAQAGEKFGVATDISAVIATFGASYNKAIQYSDPATEAGAIYDAEEAAVVGVADIIAKQALSRGGMFVSDVAALGALDGLTGGAGSLATPFVLPAVNVVSNWATDAIYENFLKSTVDSYVRSTFEASESRASYIQRYTGATSPAQNLQPITVDYGSDDAAPSSGLTPNTISAASQNSAPLNTSPSIVTNNANGSTTIQAFNADGTTTFNFSNLPLASNQRYSSYSDTYAADGTLLNEVRNLNDGSHSISIKAPGQILQSVLNDTFYAGQQGSTTFVFQPGEELGVVKGFKVGGADHDTISLLGSDFHNSIADVLRNTVYTSGGATIFDPVSGDIVRLANVTQGQLSNHKKDITFHS